MSSEAMATQPSPALPSSTEREGTMSPTYSSSSSASESEQEGSSRKLRVGRPRMGLRASSGTIIIPKDRPTLQVASADYPPDDARAMSPRRDSADLQRLGQEARDFLKDQAKTLQSSLQALAERIDEVKSDHDKLENENRFLQDYIGGLTRTMSRGDVQSTSGSKGKK